MSYKNDYSEYLKKPGMMEFIESEWTTKPEIHDFHAMVINDVIFNHSIKECIEVGCGTGNIARRISQDIAYVGIDSNEDCIKLAKEKNNITRAFYVESIRDEQEEPVKWEMVFTFGVLKHFGLHEWPKIFNKIASLGDILVFNMPVCEEIKDDGDEFHHVWMTQSLVNRYIDEAGFNVLQIVQHGVEPIFICKRKSNEPTA